MGGVTPPLPTPGRAALEGQEAPSPLFSAKESGVNLRLNVPTDLPAVALDSEHLGHVLSALLDNAREALVGPGSISVSARQVDLSEADCQDLFGSARAGAHVEITIADTGIGLTPDVQKRLFSEPFFTTKPRRRGVGLAISYGILHAHRGGVRLHPGEEHGVVARVLLPAVPAQQASTGHPEGREEMVRSSSPLGAVAPSALGERSPGHPEGRGRAPEGSRGGVTTTPPRDPPGARTRSTLATPAPAADSSGGQRPRGDRVLVVDDEPEVLQVVTTSLQRGGYRVDGVASGEAALERYFNHGGDPYRLVVTDVVMPGIGGVDLVHRLLKRDPAAQVLFLSAHVSSDFTLHDFANLGFELLPKPFRADHLLRAVRSSIDRRARRAW